ncbi:MAG: HAD-IA family hydrolase [Cytophaga sp.]|nr:HAD-IA family hydrolase [Undibacterium sp.]
METHQANFQAYQRALGDFGVKLKFDNFKTTIGQQARDFLPMLAPDLSDEQLRQVADHKAVYYKVLMHTSQANELLISFMRQMGADHTIALVTTAKRRNLDAVLHHHGLADDFDVIVCAEDVTRSKPDPEAYQLALKLTGLQSHEVIAFEDSVSGVTAAEACGIAVVQINDFAL